MLKTALDIHDKAKIKKNISHFVVMATGVELDLECGRISRNVALFTTHATVALRSLRWNVKKHSGRLLFFIRLYNSVEVTFVHQRFRRLFQLSVKKKATRVTLSSPM